MGVDEISVAGRKLPEGGHTKQRQSGQEIYDSLYNAHVKKMNGEYTTKEAKRA